MSVISKTDFSEDEWKTLQRGLTGTGMLVSVVEPGVMDSFSESNALAKYLKGQHMAGSTKLVRDLSMATGSGFGLTTNPNELRDGTLDALESAVKILSAKAPDELDPYRQLVIGAAKAVAEAKKGVSQNEDAAITAVRSALGMA